MYPAFTSSLTYIHSSYTTPDPLYYTVIPKYHISPTPSRIT